MTTTRDSSAPDATPPAHSMTAEEKRAESKRRFNAEREYLAKSSAHHKLLIELAKR